MVVGPWLAAETSALRVLPPLLLSISGQSKINVTVGLGLRAEALGKSLPICQQRAVPAWQHYLPSAFLKLQLGTTGASVGPAGTHIQQFQLSQGGCLLFCFVTSLWLTCNLI